MHNGYTPVPYGSGVFLFLHIFSKKGNKKEMKNAVKLIGTAVVTACIAYTGYSVYKYMKLKKEMGCDEEAEEENKEVPVLKKIKEKVKDDKAFSSFVC